MPNDDLQVTSPSNWNKQQTPVEDGQLVPLPSGNVVRVRRTMNMMSLLRAGRIPNPLAGIVQKMIDTGNIDLAGAMQRTGPESVKASQQLLDLLDSTWMLCVTEPDFDAPTPRGELTDVGGRKTKPNETQDEYLARLVDWKPEDGKISIFDVGMDDKMYVFGVSQGAAVDLARFRAEQDAALDLVHTESPVPDPA
jgi:hypothetical protein